MDDLSHEEFEASVKNAYEQLPEEFRAVTKDVLIRVQDFATKDVLDGLNIDHPLGLLGLYQGVDMTRKSIFDTGAMPDMVFLYREPILHYWHDRGGDLQRIIAHVLVHEVGHHFGFSDDDMHRLESED